MRTLTGAFLLGVLVAAGGCGAPPEETRGPAEHREASAPESLSPLIDRLGSPSATERDQAERDLVALGEPALPALREALANPDPEVAGRARSAIAAIELEVDRRSLRLVIACTGKQDGGGLPVTAKLSNAGRRPLVIVVRQVSIGGSHYQPPGEFVSWEFHSDEQAAPVAVRWLTCCGCETVHPLTPEHFAVIEPGATLDLPVRNDHVLLKDEPARAGRFTLRAAYEFRKPSLDERSYPDANLASLWQRALEVRVESNVIEVELGE